MRAGRTSGRVRYRASFNKPTGLEGGASVFLAVEPPRSCGVVSLNGALLSGISRSATPERFDVTGLVAERNRLEIVVEHPALDAAGAAKDDVGTLQCGGLIGEVRLEIEEIAKCKA